MSSILVTPAMARACACARARCNPRRPGRADQRVREAGIVGRRLERGVILSVERSVNRDSEHGSDHARSVTDTRRRSSTPTLDGAGLQSNSIISSIAVRNQSQKDSNR